MFPIHKFIRIKAFVYKTLKACNQVIGNHFITKMKEPTNQQNVCSTQTSGILYVPVNVVM